MPTEEPQQEPHNIFRILASKGLTTDESMELVQYVLKDLSEHMHSSPETIEKLNAFSERIEVLDTRFDKFIPALEFCEDLRKNAAIRAENIETAMTWVERGQSFAKFLAYLAALYTAIKLAWFGLFDWSLHNLPK